MPGGAVMAFDPFTALTSKIFGSVAIALGIVVAMQGCSIDRLRDARDAAQGRARAEAAAHRRTQENYRAAALEAERVQAANLARVAAEQKRISDEALASYDARLADARRRLREAGAAADSGGASTAGLPGTRAAAGGAAEASVDLLSPAERLIAAEQAIQLDELIRWVERQSRVATSPAATIPHRTAASTD